LELIVERIPFIAQDDFCLPAIGNDRYLFGPRREYSINVFIRRFRKTDYEEADIEAGLYSYFSRLLGYETIITKTPLPQELLPDGVVSPVPDEFWLKTLHPDTSVNDLLPNEPHCAGWDINAHNRWFLAAYGITMDGYHVFFYTNYNNDLGEYSLAAKRLGRESINEENSKLREAFQEKLIDALAYLGVRKFEACHYGKGLDHLSSVWMGEAMGMDHGIRVGPLWSLNSARYSQIKPITVEEFNSLPTWIFAHGTVEGCGGSRSLLNPTEHNLSIPFEAAPTEADAKKEKMNLMDWWLTQGKLRDTGKESFYSYVDAIHLIENYDNVYDIDLTTQT
jgi:hypothetical protein